MWSASKPDVYHGSHPQELLLALIKGEKKLVDVRREYDLKQSEVEGWMETFIKGGSERSLKVNHIGASTHSGAELCGM